MKYWSGMPAYQVSGKEIRACPKRDEEIAAGNVSNGQESVQTDEKRSWRKLNIKVAEINWKEIRACPERDDEIAAL